jgi:hypothetical protein
MKKQNFKCNSVLFYLFLEGFLIERETSKRNFLVVELFCVYPLNLETCREKERIKNTTLLSKNEKQKKREVGF